MTYLNIFFILLSSINVMAADYPIVMPKTTSNYLFTESINNQVGFSVSQQNIQLKDLFNSKNNLAKSELCGPTTVANQLALYKLSNNTISQNLKLNYSPMETNYINQVREYFNSCKTDKATGTLVVNLSSCLYQIFYDSGLPNSEVKVIGPTTLPNLDSKFSTTPHNVTIADIRDAFKNGYGVIMEIKWYHTLDNTNPIQWISNSGHYILVIGYDYDESFGDQKIILKVVNPEVDYSSRDPYQRYDNIEMMKIPKKSNMIYPTGSDYILDGYSFKGYPSRAFVKYLIINKPK